MYLFDIVSFYCGLMLRDKRTEIKTKKKKPVYLENLYQFTTNRKGESKSVFKYLRIKNHGTRKLCTFEGK